MYFSWSQLPNDIWLLISKKLDVEIDRCSFRLVSKSFRSYLPPLPQPPWLLLSEKHQQPLLETSESDEEGEVNVVNEENHKPSPPPPLRGLVGIGGGGGGGEHVGDYEIDFPEAHQMRCIGSTGNWLITVDKFDGIYLLNLFSRVQIDLPSQSTFKYNFLPDEDVTPEQHRDLLLKKVIMSSTPSSSTSTNKDCIVMAIHHYLHKLAIARPGDTSWTTVDTPYHHFEDIIFYKEQFYGVNIYGMVMVCDITHLHTPKATVVTENWLKQDKHDYYRKKYLLEWLGELLLVIKVVSRLCDRDDRQEYIEKRQPLYKTEKFEVYKLDFTTKRWEEVNSLGDYCLFVGFNSSVSVSAVNYLGSLKKNCIYFTDDFTFGYRATRTPGGHDMGVFDMEDKSIRPYYKGVSTCYYSPPIWIIPNPTVMNTEKESDSMCQGKMDCNL
ncbi:hypothetical protein AQUCO_01500225v1 [Aquilegia coerulea]|uniref:F-box domain-containing protein n=1 Tax=Aquilegia coerulea TaxID=218851 RepID=A0A2G5DSN7_AQUCA|nr:hypothetical protein AQUCO_01500225v1 [Aquilegia coerulea]